jgi:TDG/mug DNA glycosylase family protein
MTDDDRDELRRRGIGITNVVPRATARADELTSDELRAGGERLRSLVADLRPTVVAVAGITAYRSAFGEPRARVGEQAGRWGSSRVFVVPNPSGLNAHESIDSLAVAYGEAARAAGVIASPQDS